jgi:1-acyl-sn-glycerol-3-phosphate acyltransferase
MSWLIQVLKLFYTIYALLIFIGLTLIVFPCALTASLVGGRIKGGNFIYRICMLWADIWYFLIGIFHKNIYEQKLDPHQSYVFVANHTSYLDATLIPKAIRTPVRPLGKVEMAKIPFFGFIYKRVIVTVDRSSPQNRANSVRILKSILGKGISIFFFPEGTFDDKAEPLQPFYDGAFRIAIETGTPIRPMLFLDAYDRMHPVYFFLMSPGRCRVIFLQEVSVEGLTMKDLPQLKQQVFALMESKLREYGASWIV